MASKSNSATLTKRSERRACEPRRGVRGGSYGLTETTSAMDCMG